MARWNFWNHLGNLLCWMVVGLVITLIATYFLGWAKLVPATAERSVHVEWTCVVHPVLVYIGCSVLFWAFVKWVRREEEKEKMNGPQGSSSSDGGYFETGYYGSHDGGHAGGGDDGGGHGGDFGSGE